MAAVETGRASPKQLTYYKQSELDRLLALPARPHLLLTHDWPTWPEGVQPPTPAHAAKPEAMLLEALRPAYHLCGHHHRPAAFRVHDTEVRALNIIAEEGREGRARHLVNPGWAVLFEWTPPTATSGNVGQLTEAGFWPPLPGAPRGPSIP